MKGIKMAMEIGTRIGIGAKQPAAKPASVGDDKKPKKPKKEKEK